jgi:hypothetical protein
VAQVEIQSETDEALGWAFQAQVLDEDGGLSGHRVTLSWSDYNHWSADGADTPARVAEAVVEFLVDRDGAAALRKRFDASIARRLHADADEQIRRRIG